MSEWLGWEALGRQIRVLRRIRGLTQAELATRIGISRTSLTNIEKGRQSVSVEMYYRIAAALDYEVKVRLVNGHTPADQGE